MDPIFHEWGGLLLRWAHVVTAIAWIGSSFYFMHLDASLRPIAEIPTGKGGAAWEVHGGGFYEVKKYLEAPAHLPDHLIWHKWQAYSTWLTGFFLLVWVYYAQSQLYLIDPDVRDLSPLAAAAIGLAGLALGWIVYDGLCRSPLAKNEVALAAVGFAFIVGMAWFFQQVFSGRGALLHTGALMATMMAGNVFFNIIPGQRKTIGELLAGRTPDPKWGKDAKTRSTHNNYLTLPVLFLMLSGHYPLTFSTPYAWAIVGLILVAGAVVRHFYNVRHAGKGDPWWTWGVAAACVWAAIWISMGSAPIGRERLGLAPLPETKVIAGAPRAPEQVANILLGRCSMCHAQEPVYLGIHIAPKGIRLDTPEMMARNREAVLTQAVLTRAMPPNNVTNMTREERRIVAEWIAHSK
ncbi:urate hydroxylase PuuD [Terrirubrum flagellatum]|uniref:urate hydroxylase PuuD n=1 Tax=Terrirubrum flagellatum TaxID=2895980 RepID=UPI003CC82371